jgi:hypothetical protein
VVVLAALPDDEKTLRDGCALALVVPLKKMQYWNNPTTFEFTATTPELK